jgi:hypothetical protein
VLVLVRNKLTNTRPTLRPKMLFLCLSLSKFDHVSNLEMAHEIWSTLERYHEGMSHVKTRLFESYHGEYENFMQLPRESVDSMFSRL